jgi:hypothetical protein
MKLFSQLLIGIIFFSCCFTMAMEDSTKAKCFELDKVASNCQFTDIEEVDFDPKDPSSSLQEINFKQLNSIISLYENFLIASLGCKACQIYKSVCRPNKLNHIRNRLKQIEQIKRMIENEGISKSVRAKQVCRFVKQEMKPFTGETINNFIISLKEIIGNGFDEISDFLECIICLENQEVYQLFLPCGHANICLKCCRDLKDKKCPTCDAAINEEIKITMKWCRRCYLKPAVIAKTNSNKFKYCVDCDHLKNDLDVRKYKIFTGSVDL